jgi:hypothetical protein
VLQFGCLAGKSIAQNTDSVTWVGNTKNGGANVYRLTGISTVKALGTSAIRRVLDGEGTSISSAVGYNITLNGREFYILNLTSRSLVYDYDNELWTEFLNSAGTGPWPVQASIEHLTTVYGQNPTTGVLYQITPDTYQDESVDFTVLMRLGRVDFDTMQRKFVRGLEIIGDKCASQHYVSLQYSDDDWNTFSTARSIDMSLTRPYTDRLGNFRRRSWQLSYTNNSAFRCEAIELKIKVGDK